MRKLFLFIAALCCAVMVNAGDFSDYGALQVVGNQLCDQNGNPIQLRGWSTYGRLPDCVSTSDDETDFQKMKTAGANVARIAMYSYPADNYSSFVVYTPENVAWMKNCISFCASQNMYCVVDWHVMEPGNPLDATYAQAATFFSEITSYVAEHNYHHVLYEICSDPSTEDGEDDYVQGREVWQWVKEYAATVLPIIKANDPHAIVIVGTPQWSHELANPMADPLDQRITAGMNIMYSFHFYAADMERYLGALSTASAFMPIFVSEWGVGGLTINGSFNTAKPIADNFLAVCNGLNLGGQLISWCNWSWSDGGRASDSFQDYRYTHWSTTGNYIKAELARGDERFVTRQSSAYGEPQAFDGFNDLVLDLRAYNIGGQGHAYWDYDIDWMGPAQGAYGAANTEHGFRTDDNVDIGYTDYYNIDEAYRSLVYIVYPEWVEYTIDAKYPGDYEFELFSNNSTQFSNILGFAMDGKNCLIDNDGEEQTVVFMPPCQGGQINGYDIWGWTDVRRVNPIEGEQFYLRIPSAGEHKLGIAFLTASTGLGALKLQGKPENDPELNPGDSPGDNPGDEEESVEDIHAAKGDISRKLLHNGQLLILRHGHTYTPLGTQLR